MDTILDVFCHCLPPAFCRGVERLAERPLPMYQRACSIRVTVDLDERRRLMDSFPGYQQILSLVSPTIEAHTGPEKSRELARIGNDAMAEMVANEPERFPGFIASLPMNHPEGAQQEADRVVRNLHATGFQLYTNVLGAPLDAAPNLEIIEHLASLGRPIWLHPIRPPTMADYVTESASKLDLWWAFGWPYETSVAMMRLVCAGLFDRWPDLTIITHHCGGLIPLMEGRIEHGLDYAGHRNPPEAMSMVTREPPITGLRRFYADTASFGSRIPLEAARQFFGVERMLFASDMPFDPEEGPGFIRAGIRLLEEMSLTATERRAILADNARRLFGLPTSFKGQ
ncbi:amidohydrolase family protein [Lignipirellula cremea]|uniref:Amidohydrolase n=1 Tax=Lignipirellula cremea TaxID=2528010 RepID=A0A518DXJ7_9BACT|nr:amidohydrolase family protein [Lignipirellula cremea]QDU96548.1 Amidohydrolase [Lignipirellula cremea]